MKQIKNFEELMKLEPFTEITFVNKEKHTVNQYRYLYAYHKGWFKDGQFYATDTQFGAPVQLYFHSYDTEIYTSVSYQELKQIEYEQNGKAEIKKRYKDFEKYHWGYINGKLTYFTASSILCNIEDINGHAMDISLDDIESVLLKEPKFEDVKKLLGKKPKPNGHTLYSMKVKGSNIYTLCYDDRDSDMWEQYRTVRYESEKIYTVYYYYTDDAEGYCYTHYCYIED